VTGHGLAQPASASSVRCLAILCSPALIHTFLLVNMFGDVLSRMKPLLPAHVRSFCSRHDALNAGPAGLKCQRQNKFYW